MSIIKWLEQQQINSYTKKQNKITDSNAKSNIKILIKVYLKSGNSARYK